MYITFIAGIHGLFGQRQALQHVSRDAQPPQNGLGQGGHIPAQGQGKVVYTKHIVSSIISVDLCG